LFSGRRELAQIFCGEELLCCPDIFQFENQISPVRCVVCVVLGQLTICGADFESLPVSSAGVCCECSVMGSYFSSEKTADIDPSIVFPPLIQSDDPSKPVPIRPIVINVTVLDGRNVPANEDATYDPAIHIHLTAEGFSRQSAHTKTRHNSSPIWRQGFNFSVHPKCQSNAEITLSLVVNNGSLELGTISMPIDEITKSEYIDKHFEMGAATVRIVFEISDWGEAHHKSGPSLHPRRSSTRADTLAAEVEGFSRTGSGFSRTGSNR